MLFKTSLLFHFASIIKFQRGSSHRAWSGQEHPPLEARVHITHPTVMLHCEGGVTEDCSPLVQLEPCPPAGPQLCQWLPVHTFSVSVP